MFITTMLIFCFTCVQYVYGCDVYMYANIILMKKVLRYGKKQDMTFKKQSVIDILGVCHRRDVFL